MAFTKTKREAKKAAKKQAKKQAKRANSTFYKAVDNAGPLLGEVSKEARKKADALYSEYGPVVAKKVAKGQKSLEKGFAEGSSLFADFQSRVASELDKNLGSRARAFRSDFEEDYLPRARRTADATNTTLSSAVAAAVEAARHEWEKGAPQIREAATTSPVVDKRKSRVGTALIVLGIAAVAGSAAYVAWQKTRPVEDPWAPPADFARSHYPAAGTTELETSEVADSVASAEAGDVSEALNSSREGVAGGDAKVNTHKGE